MTLPLFSQFRLFDSQDAKTSQSLYIAGRAVGGHRSEKSAKKEGLSEEDALRAVSVFSDVMGKLIPQEPLAKPVTQPPPSATPPYGESSFMLNRLAMQNPNRQDKEKTKREGSKQGKDKGREE